ncbi:DUF3617 domain-containing protein [Aliidiomarina sp.]|uniref:DUF3617 domain-containing protein n=1 Tax=Aliidiomarina sp. TaxID=1872439 RepID=UPI003A4E00A6
MNILNAFSVTKVLVIGALLVAMNPGLNANANEPVVLDIEPGKWKHSFRIESESGLYEEAMAEARRQLEAMPQAQRQMFEDMLAQQGISLDNVGGSAEICISQQEIDAGIMPQQEGCSQSLSPKDGANNVYQTHFSCEADGAEGVGEITIVDRQNYNAVIDAVVAMQDQPEMITIHQTGEWLGECDS